MEIKLKSLHLENFKCHKSLTLAFDGKNASIYGDNATGKTSIYDAFVWLLFGRDSTGNGEKNMDIKPLDSNGSVIDHNAITEVEAVLLADGEEVSLKKTYREVWSTKRGNSEATYDGNTSDYYVDGVPCKANAYKSKVAELVDEERFRLLTTVSYFPATLPWQKRREVLFDLFGIQGDKEIMGTDERFTELRDALGKVSLEDFKKVLLSKRKGYMVTRNEVPARISEQEKTIAQLGDVDFDEADAEVRLLNARKNQLEAELLGMEHNTSADKKRIELQEANLQLQQLETDNRRWQMQQMATRPGTAGLERELEAKRNALRAAERQAAIAKAAEEKLNSEINALRTTWKSVHDGRWSGETVCPTCGQPLPAAKIQEAKAAFEKDKQDKLGQLVDRSDGKKAELKSIETERAEAEGYVREFTQDIRALTEKIRAAESEAASPVSDMEGYEQKRAGLLGWIENIQRELDGMKRDSFAATSDLKRRISECRAEIDKASEIAGKRSLLAYAHKRIEELREEAKRASDELGEIDRMLYAIEEYSRYKASFVEGGINDHFRLARFRLFREQANGGTEDRCDVVYDGVPYMSLNNGMKINVGIDIINALSRAYGVRVPLFVDNAESVTNLEMTDGQVIRLVVSENDKELRSDEN